MQTKITHDRTPYLITVCMLDKAYNQNNLTPFKMEESAMCKWFSMPNLYSVSTVLNSTHNKRRYLIQKPGAQKLGTKFTTDHVNFLYILIHLYIGI